MAQLPEGITQQDLDRYAHLTAGIAVLEAEKDALNTQIKAAYAAAGYSGKHTLVYPSPRYGSVIVTIGEQRRVDQEALVTAFPRDRFPEYWKPVIDVDAIPATTVLGFRTPTMTLSIKGENPLPDHPEAALVTAAPRRLVQDEAQTA
mgnify:CR=1 FL=1